eukprot:COSAG03_NODE_38_length_17530_cov_148.572223_19_plen_404_part_00
MTAAWSPRSSERRGGEGGEGGGGPQCCAARAASLGSPLANHHSQRHACRRFVVTIGGRSLPAHVAGGCERRLRNAFPQQHFADFIARRLLYRSVAVVLVIAVVALFGGGGGDQPPPTSPPTPTPSAAYAPTPGLGGVRPAPSPAPFGGSPPPPRPPPPPPLNSGGTRPPLASAQFTHGALDFSQASGSGHVVAPITTADLPTSQITVESWIKYYGGVEWAGPVSFGQDDGSQEKGIFMSQRAATPTSTQLAFAVSTVGANTDGDGVMTYLSDAASTIDMGLWHHFAGTYDGQSVKIFVDGRMTTSDDNSQHGDIYYPDRSYESREGGWFTLGAYHDQNEYYPINGLIPWLSLPLPPFLLLTPLSLTPSFLPRRLPPETPALRVLTQLHCLHTALHSTYCTHTP